MYHFVKIRPKDKPETKGVWYFVPNSIEQVQEHFNKISIYWVDVKSFPTYEEACEASIKYCLENLI